MEILIILRLQVPNGLGITGRVKCYDRKENELQIPHKIPGTQKEFPGSHWEIEVSDLILQILPKKSARYFFRENSKKKRENLVKGLHIEIGNDLRPYICFPILPKEDMLISAIKIWLVHQALYNTEGINFGLFEGFVLHDNPNFEDWIKNGKYMQYIPEDQKNFLRTKESLFEKVREVYHKESIPGNKYSGELVAEIIARLTGITVTTNVG